MMNAFPYIIATLPGALLIVFLIHPEKVEKWSVILWKVIYFVFQKGEKKIITHDIQGRINEFMYSVMDKIPNFDSTGIKIQWVTGKEKPSNFMKDNILIIRMKQHQDQNRNFVYASMVFISKVILSKTKAYISPSQSQSIDLFIGKKLFEKEKPEIVNRFFDDYFATKALSNEKVAELLDKYEIIDKTGLFFSVLIQELTFLGEKVFLKPRTDKIIVEVSSFIEFLHKYSEREIGKIGVPTNFEGAFCKCGIAIIAKSARREASDTETYLKYIHVLISIKKLDSIYLIGSGLSANKEFMDTISNEIVNRYRYGKVASRFYNARIKHMGQRKEVNNYLAHHRSPNIERVYDSEFK